MRRRPMLCALRRSHSGITRLYQNVRPERLPDPVSVLARNCAGARLPLLPAIASHREKDRPLEHLQ